MAVISESVWYDLLLSIIVIAISLYIFLKSKYDYWKNQGVPYAKPLPLFGNIKDILFSKKHMVEVFTDIYYQLDGHKFGGYFETINPSLMVRDPELINRILVKDFSHFYDRNIGPDPKKDPLSANLANLQGEAWRQLRYKLTPTFSPGKLKGMFDQISHCGEKLNNYIDEQSKIEKALDGKAVFSNYTMEVIGTCVFGIQMNEENEMTRSFRKVVKEVFRPSTIQNMKVVFMFLFPRLARKLGTIIIPKRVETVTVQIIKDVLNYRKNNKIERDDFLQMLLNLQKEEQNGNLSYISEVEHDQTDDVTNQMKHASAGKNEKPMKNSDELIFTDEFIAAQAFIFFLAGTESVTTPASFTLFDLTQNPEIMKKVQNEIDTVLASHGNKWSYQAMKEMIYLDQVIQETFRKYTVSINLFRICTQTYKIPDTNVVIEEGMKICIPMHSIHNDPKYYESPETFNPDRFKDNNFKPSGTYMPFGHGPRICIAMRFAVLEMKVLLARVLSQYSVRLSSKTKMPLKYDVATYIPLPVGGLWYEFDKRLKT